MLVVDEAALASPPPFDVAGAAGTVTPSDRQICYPAGFQPGPGEAGVTARKVFVLKSYLTRLRRGALYTATLGSRSFTFKVDAKAKTGNAPVVSRLLRFPPG